MIFKGKESVCSVALDVAKCKGCVHCMRKCPTEAIRVRDGRAFVIEPRCVGCGECVRSCPTRAKIAVSDPLERLHDYRFRVALPCPSCFGQFPHLRNADILLQGLVEIGFDDVEEVALGAEAVSAATREYLKNENIPRPVISSACPAIVKLIQISYGHLVKHISPVMTPEEIAAAAAVERARKLGYRREEIGVFVVSPCSAKWEAFRGSERIDGVVSFEEIYFKLVAAMNRITDPPKRSRTGKLGLAWANSGGEADGARARDFLAADGVENCMKVIEEIDHDKLGDLDFVELNACPGGCVGGVFNLENPFLATTRIRALKKTVPAPENFAGEVEDCFNREKYLSDNVFRLSEDRVEAMRMMQMIECIHAALPGVDCGSCGAPSCRAMAEDIALHGKEIDGCPFIAKRNRERA